MSSSVPTPTFGPRGFIAPQESAILVGVQSDFNQAFGGNLNPGLTTPQGQLATSETAIIGNVNDTFVYMTNQFNPSFNSGRWQDGIAQIYFITRYPSEPTVVQATCSGGAGVVIPLGTLAQAADSNVYVCTQAGVIGAGGTVVLTFACTVPGPIACPANSLNTIYQSIPGWDSINNGSDGVIGQNTESDRDFEARRFLSVAGNSAGALPSIRGAVLSVAGVLDAYVTENSTSGSVTIGGVTLVANSLYVAAVGGTAADVAHAIWTKKSPGCNYNGNTSVVVYDTSYPLPQPSYTVLFQIPQPLPIIFAVDIANNALVPANAADLIAAAIVSAFSGGDGGTRATIGSAIYASRYYGAVAALGSWVQIISILIGCQNTAAAHCTTGHITGTAFTEAGVTTGTFAIGQTLVDKTGYISPGTVIISGTSPNWVVNNSQTVTAEIVYGVVAGQNEVTAQIDQSPTISALNIAVTVT